MGGAGFVTYFLWKELKKGVDALGPDNIMVFALGPVSGLQLPGAARHCVGAKSPLTGGLAKSEAGGFWAAQLKRAGYDAVIIKGRAEKPVYLWIQDGEAVIRDATHLWGKNTKETMEGIRDELGDRHIQTALIGPAGENLVRYACIMHGLHDAGGRGGLGAVMGSKNLKAVAVRGHKLPKLADPERLKQIQQEMLAVKSPLTDMGTGGPDMEVMESLGNLPVRNFRDGLFPEVSKIHGGVIKDTIRVGMEGCYACHVRCKKVVRFEKPYPVDAAYGGPEYETLAALGSNLVIDNLKAIAKGNELCNAYSLDTISTGNVIAFAMECFEKGLLNKDDTGGIELRFGNDEAMLKAIELICRRQGVGNLLAEGTASMARKIGKGSEAFAMNVKGLEPGMHEPRLSAGFGLINMVNPTGADHCSSLPDFAAFAEPRIINLHHLGIVESLPAEDISPLKVAYARLVQATRILNDCLVLCAFVEYSLDKQAEIVAATTGWETGGMDLIRVTERVLTTARLINYRDGFTSADDKLPERFYQPKTNGVLEHQCLDRDKLEESKRYYYTLMGWDKNGIPLPQKVEELRI
jgi:aldehyde:ferredoxin oxidoreductase